MELIIIFNFTNFLISLKFEVCIEWFFNSMKDHCMCGFYILFLNRKICVLARGYFILYLHSSGPHFAGAAVLFMLSLPCSGCVLQVSGIISDG